MFSFLELSLALALSVLSKQSSLTPQGLQIKCSGLHGLQEAI